MAYLVLVRHGESTWNKVHAWTGLTDISLDEEGKGVARKDGELLKDIHFDLAFTSALRRAQQSLEEIKLVIGEISTTEAAALNERDYGDLTGKNKLEMEEMYGSDQYIKWRRGWDEVVPNGETLKDVYNRVVSYYQEKIFPELKNEKNVLVVAHGNSLRALVKFLENIPDEDIPNLEIETGEIIVYEMDETGKIIKSSRRLPDSP